MTVRKRIPDLDHPKHHSPTHRKKNRSVFGSIPLREIATSFILASLTYLAYRIYILESPINAVYYKTDDPPEYTGPLEINDFLNNAERLFEGNIKGPECLLFHKGHLYTGTADGKVLDIVGDKINVLATLGTGKCGTLELEPTCGRPLGLAIHNDLLYVLDTYLGLFTITLDKGVVKKLLPGDVEVEGLKSKFLNALDIAEDGTLYMTDSSTKFARNKFPYSILSLETSGRVIKYNPKTNTTVSLLDNLGFANGLVLSKNEDFILVSETSKLRIIKLHLKGAEAGRREIFAANLPGAPDNLRWTQDNSGDLLVASALPRLHGAWSLHNLFGEFPRVKNFLAKILSMKTLMRLVPLKTAVVIRLDPKGQPVSSMWCTNSRVSGISEAVEHDGHLYIGSFRSPYIGRVKLD